MFEVGSTCVRLALPIRETRESPLGGGYTILGAPVRRRRRYNIITLAHFARPRPCVQLCTTDRAVDRGGNSVVGETAGRVPVWRLTATRRSGRAYRSGGALLIPTKRPPTTCSAAAASGVPRTGNRGTRSGASIGLIVVRLLDASVVVQYSARYAIRRCRRSAPYNVPLCQRTPPTTPSGRRPPRAIADCTDRVRMRPATRYF